ncbi:unnamed protein product [Rodentolepis nana]|uniref:Uncharacterized protein n=1 Tax=Rodentolepis nana TaxID=102285 RepID=A0A0R3T564_RODNA|nr:unnamed protein product [Rodentolepis nana]
MAEPICRCEEFYITPPSYHFLPQTALRRVDFADESNQQTVSPNPSTNSSSTTTEYNGFRSRSLEPSPYNSFKQHHVPTAPILTPNPIRARNRQQLQVAFSTPESDYETPETVWRRAQLITPSVRRTESSRYPYKLLPDNVQSNLSGARAQIGADATSKGLSRSPEEVTPKPTLHFGPRKRFTGLTSSVRRELLAPQIQRRYFRPVKTDDEDSDNDVDCSVETKPITLAEVLKQRNGVRSKTVKCIRLA